MISYYHKMSLVPNEAEVSCCLQLLHLTILSQDEPSASASVTEIFNNITNMNSTYVLSTTNLQ